MTIRKHFHKIIPFLLVCCLVLVLWVSSGCKKSLSEGDLIVITMSKTTWGMNFSNSTGYIEVYLQGEGVSNIILDTIEMIGDNPSTPHLKAQTAEYQGNRVCAEFAKNRVMGLLSNPTNGSIHKVTIVFNTHQSSETVEVSTDITVSDFIDDGSNPSTQTLEIDPDVWNLNFSHSSGTVEAFIRGDGIDQVDLASFQMKGDNAAAFPLTALSAALNGDHIHARFPKNQVINLLLDPADGTTHTIVVSFLTTGSTERTELTAQITIEEDDDVIDPSDLSLEIDPVVWNLNFTKSSGTVEAFIRGEGIEQIDLGSIEMRGDDPSAAPLAASSASLSGDHIHARFPKNQVIGLLLNPAEGTTHIITVSFLLINGTERIELTAQITIEEDDDDGNIDPSTLSLQLSPPDWNLNFSKSSGTVKALIRGEGIENIDLNSIEMKGDNPAASSLSGQSASLQGNHVSVDFPKNQVLDLLLNPAKGTNHTVTVSFLSKINGQQFELSTQVRITGNAN